MSFWNIFKRNAENQSKTKYPRTGAVIVAAGSGARMGGSINKQLIDISGCPILVRSIAAFEKAETISEIVVVTSEDIIGLISDYIKLYSFEKVTTIIKGGSTRQESVSLGLKNIGQSCEYIAIHDGARPFATPELIDRVSSAAYGTAGAIAGVKVSNTIKQVDESGYVEKTISRDYLYQIQTPQTFNTVIYKTALKTAQLSGYEYTDDSQLLENIGKKIKIVDGEECNIKITTPLDVTLGRIIAEKCETE